MTDPQPDPDGEPNDATSTVRAVRPSVADVAAWLRRPTGGEGGNPPLRPEWLSAPGEPPTSPAPASQDLIDQRQDDDTAPGEPAPVPPPGDDPTAAPDALVAPGTPAPKASTAPAPGGPSRSEHPTGQDVKVGVSAPPASQGPSVPERATGDDTTPSAPAPAAVDHPVEGAPSQGPVPSADGPPPAPSQDKPVRAAGRDPAGAATAVTADTSDVANEAAHVDAQTRTSALPAGGPTTAPLAGSDAPNAVSSEPTPPARQEDRQPAAGLQPVEDQWALQHDRPSPAPASAPLTGGGTAVATPPLEPSAPGDNGGSPMVGAPPLFGRLHLPHRPPIQLRRPQGRLTEATSAMQRVASLIGVLIVVSMMGLLLAMGVGGAVLVIGLAIQHAINSKG